MHSGLRHHLFLHSECRLSEQEECPDPLQALLVLVQLQSGLQVRDSGVRCSSCLFQKDSGIFDSHLLFTSHHSFKKTGQSFFQGEIVSLPLNYGKIVIIFRKTQEASLIERSFSFFS